jgi:PPOX class probable F420-dependent enzyme
VTTHDEELKAQILDLLDEHKLMAVATVRPDGWPQTTLVGYAHDGLNLYFVVAAGSQKATNIARDGRVSIALGHEAPTRLRGLSMAALAEVVTDLAEIDAINTLLIDRYPGQAPFSPRETNSVLVRATPTIVSIIDVGKGPGEPRLVSVADPQPAGSIEARGEGGAPRRVTVHAVRSVSGGYRPGAPP